MVAASLLFLALASYRPTDPSFNTVGALGRPVHNWIGLIGASLSDILLQLEGVAAFLIPVMLGILGWTWLRSRPAGSLARKYPAYVFTWYLHPRSSASSLVICAGCTPCRWKA